jgi:hypothetical protein
LRLGFRPLGANITPLPAMKEFWTPERSAQLERHLKAGKSTMEIALAMGLKRKQVTNKCVRSGLVSMCVDCGVKPKYRQYRRCISCKEAREVAAAALREWNTNAQALAKANRRFLAALEATGRTFDEGM